MKPIRVAVCDDAAYLCNNIKMYLEDVEDMEFAGYALNSQDCINLIKNTHTDVLLLDIQMENETSGIDILAELKKIKPELIILMITSYEDKDYIFSSLTGGASDYIIKSGSLSKIIEKIRLLASGKETAYSPEVMNKFRQKSQELAFAHQNLQHILGVIITLSVSEMEILKLLYSGKTYEEIAEIRFVDISTVRSLASRIMHKFGIKPMKELIKTLQESKIFDMC